MYHEVAPALPGPDEQFMTPSYVMTSKQFEEQMQTLAESGYRSLLFDEVESAPPGGKYVVITFDDGLAGNYTHAAPILRRYGFRATFFVAVGLVSTPYYMTWAQLKELADAGMAIQSHTVNHRPLETLPDVEVRTELQTSKSTIEGRVGVRVTAFSFPHGSYDARSRRIAHESGYRFLCTSDVQRTCQEHFRGRPALLGRFAVTHHTDTATLMAWVHGQPSALLSARLRKGAKTLLRKTIGVRNYSRLYQLYFGIRPRPRSGDP